MWSRFDNHMETVQKVLDKKLLQAADRDALREHLQRLELRAKEARDRRD